MNWIQKRLSWHKHKRETGGTVKISNSARKKGEWNVTSYRCCPQSAFTHHTLDCCSNSWGKPDPWADVMRRDNERSENGGRGLNYRIVWKTRTSNMKTYTFFRHYSCFCCFCSPLILYVFLYCGEEIIKMTTWMPCVFWIINSNHWYTLFKLLWHSAVILKKSKLTKANISNTRLYVNIRVTNS